jgi:outer membrane protein assembly factor BamA
LTYTQQKQTTISFLPEIYFKNESYYFNGFYGYYKYPDKFWGISNDTPDTAEEDYEPNHFKSYTNFQKRTKPGVYIGLRYQYEYISLKKTNDNGVLQYKTVTGSEGGSASGLGIIINHDTRNHIYQPSSGFYNQIYAVFFGKAMGSEYQFNLFSFDLRKYYSLFGSHVLAFQSYNSFISGNPPFQMLNLLGGAYWMRGYFIGRYRDKNMVTFQAEYRLPLFWRFGAVGFAGFGDVASQIDKFQLNDFKYTVGFGFRFMFDSQERINARLDIGFGKGGNSRIYALVIEAF